MPGALPAVPQDELAPLLPGPESELPADRDQSAPETYRDRETLERTAEALDDWFGTDDAACVTFEATLGPSSTEGHPYELYVRGVPLSRALDQEALAYYREAFLPALLREGRASWRGAETDQGLVRDGTIAERTGESVRLTFALRVSDGGRGSEDAGGESAPRGQDHVAERAWVPEPEVIDLDHVLRR